MARPRNTPTHGMTDTPEYNSWSAMRQRCNKRKSKVREEYVGRNITVCPEWQASFHAFYRDMGPRPEGKTLDRIDNDKGYYPDNCRWASPVEQARNSRQVKLCAEKVAIIRGLKIMGLRHSQIAREFGMDASTISRMCDGMTWKEVEPHPAYLEFAGFFKEKRKKPKRTPGHYA